MRAAEVERNSGASLIDLGRRRGVLRISCQDERHRADLDRDDSQRIERLETDFDAMVIANQAVNFSVGANLMLVLVGAQEQEWDELHMAVKQFQNVNLAIKYAKKAGGLPRRRVWHWGEAAKSVCTLQEFTPLRRLTLVWWKPEWD